MTREYTTNGVEGRASPNPPTVYKIRNADGHLIAEKHRVDKPGGDKDCFWKRPGTGPKEWGLNGTPVGDLPLYGAEQVATWEGDDLIVLAEGEKTCDALAGTDFFYALGTVTGAGGTPGEGTLEVLRDRRVVLWPDNDEPGRKHMERIADRLHAIAAEVLIYTWHDAPENGDAADHPAVKGRDRKALGKLLTDLEGAPRFKPQPEPQRKPEATRRRGGGDKETPTDDELRDRVIATHPDYAYGMGEWREYRDGVWEGIDEVEVKDGACRIMEAAKGENVRPTRSLMNSVTELTRVRVAVPSRMWDANPDILVCANGTLDLTTRELKPHARENYATAAAPYDYDEDAKSVSWNLVMDQVVAANLGKAAVGFLQEFAGYALTTSTEHEIALWLTGKHGGGRSTILAGLQAMLGPRAGVLSLSDIERSSFGLTNIPGKTLVTATEQPAVYLRGGGVLNAIISGEPVQVDRKYHDPVTIIPRCKIAWAMNELPRVGNSDDGIFRRVKILEVPEIPPEKQDPRVKENVMLSGSAILNWALDGLDRLNERGHFEVPPTIRSATDSFRETNDVPAMFIDEACERLEDASEAGQRLYETYKGWCLQNGHKPLASNNAAREWNRLGFENKHTREGARWGGLRITDAAWSKYGERRAY